MGCRCTAVNQAWVRGCTGVPVLPVSEGRTAAGPVPQREHSDADGRTGRPPHDPGMRLRQDDALPRLSQYPPHHLARGGAVTEPVLQKVCRKLRYTSHFITF